MKHIRTLLFLLVFASGMQAQQLTIGTYNIRNDNGYDDKNGNNWSKRSAFVIGLIAFNDFDILGTQELLHNQVQDLLKGLPQYSYVGVGRDDGKQAGEYAALFYKKDKFELLKSGTFWLSPNENYPNKGWDASYVRVCSWAQLKDKVSHKKIWCFNLHMDNDGVEARKNSARLILDKIKKWCGDEPVILTGDFNIDQTNESYQLLATSGILADSYQKAPVRYIPNGTFNDFNPSQVSNSRIDHIFLSRHFIAERYGVLTDSYWTYLSDNANYDLLHDTRAPFEEKGTMRLPSDHYPIKIIVHFTGK